MLRTPLREFRLQWFRWRNGSGNPLAPNWFKRTLPTWFIWRSLTRSLTRTTYLSFMIPSKPISTQITSTHTASQVSITLWLERTWEKDSISKFLAINFFSKYICAGLPECSAKNSSTKSFISFCKLKKTDSTERIRLHFKKILSSSYLTKKNSWKISSSPSLTPSPNNNEPVVKKSKESTLKKRKRLKVLDRKMEQGRKTTFLKSDSLQMKETKMTMKMMSQMTMNPKMMKMLTIIDRFGQWCLSLNCIN